jgi:hypothetical protein
MFPRALSYEELGRSPRAKSFGANAIVVRSDRGSDGCGAFALARERGVEFCVAKREGVDG